MNAQRDTERKRENLKPQPEHFIDPDLKQKLEDSGLPLVCPIHGSPVKQFFDRVNTAEEYKPAHVIYACGCHLYENVKTPETVALKKGLNHRSFARLMRRLDGSEVSTDTRDADMEAVAGIIRNYIDICKEEDTSVVEQREISEHNETLEKATSPGTV